MTSEEMNTVDQLLEALESPDESRRASAVHQLGQSEQSRPEVILALEKIVATEQDSIIQREALEALDSPANRRLRSRRKPYSISTRKLILHEISSWESEGLLGASMVQLLAGRYAVAQAQPAQTAKDKKPAPPVERRSLGQVLLSETTIRVALFLGAFFILAAALILAALVEVARLPILSATTIAFLVAAGVLYRRIRLSSFIMFIVGTLLIAIDGGVLIDQLGVMHPTVLLSWSVISVVLGVIFAAGMLLYDSRLLSLLSYAFLVVSAYFLALSQELGAYEIHLLAAVFVMAGLVAARTLDKYGRRHLVSPVFLASHWLLGLTLAVSAVTILMNTAFGSPPDGLHWLSIAALYSISGLAYTFSTIVMTGDQPQRYQSAKGWFRILSIGAITPVPLFLAAAFGPSDLQLMIVAWIWGLAMVATAELAEQRLAAITSVYPPLMIMASALLFSLASIYSWWAGSVAAVAFLAASAVVYYLTNARRNRWPIWSASLLAGYLAYTAAFDLTGLASLDLSPSYTQLLPVTILFVVAVLLIARDRTNQARWLPPLGLSSFVAFYIFLYTVASEIPVEAAILSIYYAALFGIFAWRTGYHLAFFGSTAGLSSALYFLLLENDVGFFIWPYVTLAAIYYLVGIGLAWRGWIKNSKLSEILRWSGLVISFLASMLILDNSDLYSAVAVIVAAVMFTYETWHRRNLWLGYPAALLYFTGYAALLAELDVNEPQFYSMFAATLGLTMHYLMLKVNNRTPALATGIAAQLILLTTTYVQMVSTDELRFFVFLFCQALVLLAYGVFLRSLSFVAGPVFFIVLGVITVTVSVLSGLPVALMIGFVGFVLLLLGTMGLWLRRRLVSTMGGLGSQLAGWNW